MSDGYEVGYKKPPREHQFKKGQSGNPTGKRKTKPATGLEMPAHFANLMLIEADRRVPATENGRDVKISTTEGILRRLSIDALKGDKKAAALWLRLLESALQLAKLDPAIRPGPEVDFSEMSAIEAAEAYRRFIRGERLDQP